MGMFDDNRGMVISFLKKHGGDERDLEIVMECFGFLTATEYAYNYGWRGVLAIFKRMYE